MVKIDASINIKDGKPNKKKVIVFNDDKEVIKVIDSLENAEPYSLKEIEWQGGGIANIDENFVIVDLGTEFEEVTEEEIQEQQKLQAKLEIARDYEKKRIKALATGKEQEAQAEFEKSRAELDKAKDKEQIKIGVMKFKNKTF